MGNFYSAADSVVDVYKFSSDQQIDFQFSQLRTFETVKAAGQQQALAQVANVGGLGGGGAGGGFSALTPWGNTPSIWLGVSNFFVVSSVLVVPAAIITAILAFVLHLGRVVAFLSVFFAVSWAAIWFMYHTQSGLRLATFPQLSLYGLFAGAIAGAVAAVAYPAETPAAAGAAGGAAGGVAVGGGGTAAQYPMLPALPAQPVRF